MNWKYIVIVLLQTSSLAGGQAMFKLLLNKMGKFEWSWAYIKDVTVTHGWIGLIMLLFFGLAFFFWVFMLKKMDFSQAYPLSSLSFIFGLFLACILLGETIPFTRWIGVVLIVVGCILIGMK